MTLPRLALDPALAETEEQEIAGREIPLSRPDISDADIQAVVDVLRTPFLSLGPKLAEFEECFAAYTGARFATAASSGTAALHLAVGAMGLGPGDEVITSPFSFVASANCLLFENAVPVFADIDPVTFNVNPELIERLVTPRTRAILPVHVFGRPADMDAILEIAERHNLRVIEDSCEALGARWRGRAVGTLGDAGAFAFYPNKQMTTGEGGMIVTSDPAVDRLFKSLRNQGRGESGAWLQHERLGFNYRLSDINCALGLSQLSRIDAILESRRLVAEEYRRHLAAICRRRAAGVRHGRRRSELVRLCRAAHGIRPHRSRSRPREAPIGGHCLQRLLLSAASPASPPSSRVHRGDVSRHRGRVSLDGGPAVLHQLRREQIARVGDVLRQALTAGALPGTHRP